MTLQELRIMAKKQNIEIRCFDIWYELIFLNLDREDLAFTSKKEVYAFLKKEVE